MSGRPDWRRRTVVIAASGPSQAAEKLSEARRFVALRDFIARKGRVLASGVMGWSGNARSLMRAFLVFHGHPRPCEISEIAA